MGSLVTVAGIKETIGVRWYAKYGLGTLPCDEFPFEAAMDTRVMEGNRDLQIAVRKFVEQQLRDTVIYSYLDLTYYYEYERGSSGYQIDHGYDRFFFESEESAIMFKLHFSEHLTEVKTLWQEGRRHWREAESENVWVPRHLRGY